MIQNSCRMLCVSLLLLFALAAQKSQAQKYPLEVELALMQSKIVAGEPLLLHYKIRNVSSQNVYPELGDQRDAWLTVTASNEQGDSASKKTRWDPLPAPGYGGHRVDDMTPGKEWEDDLALTQRINITQPGHYKVLVTINVAYSRFAWPARDSKERAYVGSQTLDLIVTPRNDAYLRHEAEVLRRSIIGLSKSPLSQEMLIKALFSMPSDIAMPSWKRLFDGDYQMYMNYAAAELARINAPEAVDILFDYLGKPLEKYAGGKEKLAIERVYLYGNAETRAHIRKMWTQKIGALLPFYDRADKGEFKTFEEAQRARY